jgi:hypothetical protein
MTPANKLEVGSQYGLGAPRKITFYASTRFDLRPDLVNIFQPSVSDPLDLINRRGSDLGIEELF